MKYKTYAEYKESGVEWLGEVPAHWKIKRLKNIVTSPLMYGANEAALDIDKQQPRFVRITDVNDDGTLRDETFRSLPKNVAKPYMLKEGDILLARSGGTVGKSFIYSSNWGDCCFAGYLIKASIKKEQVDPYWVYRFTETRYYWEWIQSIQIQATIQNVSAEKYNNFYLCFPPLEEQQQIAAFLDQETAKIDKLIKKQQQLIKLLEEKRQAVISHAVTKGLNPAAKMKDSGVEWLGEVPAHWGLAKIKWFFQTESGGTPNTSKYEEYYEGGSISWIRTTDLNNGDLYETPVSITEKAVVDTVCSILPINSVLVAMYGGAGTIGKHSLLKFRSTINQAVCAILPHPKIEPQYLHLYIEFYRPYWMVGAEGARKDPNINQDVIRNLVVPYPPQEEQLKIVSKVKSKLSVIDKIINKSRVAIDLLKERRTALISAAVTGKIDVRDAV